jgi:hypothetical protein
MMRVTTFLSRRCCGGPVLVLSLALVLFGLLFILLSATGLGWMFITIGTATFGLCLLLGRSRCARHLMRAHPPF